ncbi:MAG: MerR family transcriptional regulator [Chitinophagaceae bacterium]
MRKALTQISFDFGAATESSVHQDQSAPELLITGAEPIEETASPALETATKETEVAVLNKAASSRKPGSTRGRRSLRDNAIKADLVDVPADEELFKKAYYPIGEVARMFGENQSLIRYWESEFDILKPRKNKKGDRYFRPVDIKNLVLIHDLLRRRKFTIEGAREYLRQNKKAEEKFALIQSLEKMKAFFLELKAQL